MAMSNNYKIRELRVELRPGVVLVIDVDSIEAVNKILKDLRATKLFALEGAPGKEIKDTKLPTEDPTSRLELRANLPGGSLSAKNILAFKDNVPQLLRPNLFKTVSDAALVLLYAVEGGLRQASIDYESFRGLYDSQNIKSGSPLAMLITNLRNANYIDRKAYLADRTLRLTAKGDRKAREVLNELASRK
jgi:hypothetical protein